MKSRNSASFNGGKGSKTSSTSFLTLTLSRFRALGGFRTFAFSRCFLSRVFTRSSSNLGMSLSQCCDLLKLFCGHGLELSLAVPVPNHVMGFNT